MREVLNVLIALSEKNSACGDGYLLKIYFEIRKPNLFSYQPAKK